MGTAPLRRGADGEPLSSLRLTAASSQSMELLTTAELHQRSPTAGANVSVCLSFGMIKKAPLHICARFACWHAQKRKCVGTLSPLQFRLVVQFIFPRFSFTQRCQFVDQFDHALDTCDTFSISALHLSIKVPYFSHSAHKTRK
eukprot:SAG31_NODE_1605_length_7765_cov_2.124315_8_plen_143_part_00